VKYLFQLVTVTVLCGFRLNIEARKTLTLDAKKKDKIKDRTRARRSHGPGFQGTTLIVREVKKNVMIQCQRQ
jgi:hypothetical protein